MAPSSAVAVGAVVAVAVATTATPAASFRLGGGAPILLTAFRVKRKKQKWNLCPPLHTRARDGGKDKMEKQKKKKKH